MIYRLILPATFEDIREVRVLEWHCRPDDRAVAGQLVVELETHKAVIEVRAGQDGILRRRVCEEGEWCPREGLLALFSDEANEALPDDSSEEPLIEARFALA